ncbi:tetratricopeptide repeat protein [Candidatus Poribacteria bacterium]|nr:tetratricopeptide repeat protein [Candidatus Poribacteria bacterium]
MGRVAVAAAVLLMLAAGKASEAASMSVAQAFAETAQTCAGYRAALDRITKASQASEALAYLQSRVDASSDDALARYGYGELLRRLSTPGVTTSQMEQALEHLQAAMALLPGDAEARRRVAEAAYALRDSATALETLRPLLDPAMASDDEPTYDAEARHIAANVHLQSRDYTQAEVVLGEILDHEPDDVDSRLRLAEVLRIKGRYDESAEHLGIALRHRQRSPAIYYALGKIYAHQNESDKAVDMYRRARTYDPDNARSRYELANIFLDNDNGRYAILSIRSALALDKRYADVVEELKGSTTLKALPTLERALEREPGNAHLQLFVGKLLLKTGDRAAARRRFELAKAADPSNAAARAELAVLLSQEAPEQAAEELKAAAASAGADADPSVLAPLSEVYRREGNTEAYVETTRQLLATSPDMPQKEAELGDGLVQLAKAARDAGDKDAWRAHLREAAGAYERAVALVPSNAEWRFRLGTIYDDLGQLKALRLYQEASELDATNAKLYYRWGVFLLNFTMGNTGFVRLYDPEDALKHLSRAVALDPSLGGAHYALGVAYKRQSSTAEATRAFERADELGFMGIEGLLYLADVYANSDQGTRALEMLRRAVKGAPDDVEVLKDFGFLGLRHGEGAVRSEALDALGRAVELAPDDPEALMNYGYGLHNIGRSDEGLPYLTRAVSLDPRSELALYNLALALEASGDIGGALERWHQLIALDPDGNHAEIARERITYLGGR